MLNIMQVIDFFDEERKELIMQQEVITSVDFGSKKLSVSIACSMREEIEILASKSCKSIGIEKGLIVDIDKCRDITINLLKELEDKTQKDVKNLSIGISANKARITEVTTIIELKEEKVTSEEIRKALKKAQKDVTINEEECIIDTLINFYILDGKVIHKDILNWKGKKLELNLTIVISEEKEIQKYYELFEGTKYRISAIKLNVLTGKQIFLNEKNSIGNIVLVDIGAGTTDIALLNNGIPKNVESIPVGGNNITNDLSICGGFSFLEADNMKKIYSSNYKALYMDSSVSDEIEVGTIKVSKKLFYEVVNARIEEILSYVNIKLKNTGHYDRIYSIILYGDGVSYFEDINEIVQKVFEIQTKIITRNELGIKNSENITSMAIAKEVYDRLNLLDNKSIVKPITQPNKNNENKVIDEKDNLHNNESENHIIKKLRNFFSKIF